MSFEVEVCIDNVESLHYAIKGGASRIELCSSLALGGLTPSYGMMKQAVKISSVPVYAMIRPRQGDFLYDCDDVESMLEDIYAAKKAGMQGVVFGILTNQGRIDVESCKQLMEAANGLGVTFHRAIDQCADYKEAVESIKEIGCKRILTSGLSPTAAEGIETIKKIKQLAGESLSVMAGAGVNATNAARLIKETGIRELHLSGKSERDSHMQVFSSAQMGASDINDYKIPVTSTQKVAEVLNSLNSLS